MTTQRILPGVYGGVLVNIGTDQTILPIAAISLFADAAVIPPGGIPVVINLPPASQLRAGNKRWKYRFYTTTDNGMEINAWPLDKIHIGGVEGTQVSCDVIGCYLELFAVDDRNIGCSSEHPEGSWVLT